MAEKGNREKIAGGATVRRLKKQARKAGGAAVLFLAACPAAFFLLSGGGRIACAVLFCAVGAAGWALCLRLALSARRITREADRYAFAVTQSASFECFGPFLAMNVFFRDGEGVGREGRTGFLFGVRDVEAWQNVPLEIAYRAGDERVILIGGAPGEKNS